MSMLAALARAYDRLADQKRVPPYGYSSEKIGFIVSLNGDGAVAGVIDWREGTGRKLTARPMAVPQPVKRTVAIAPNFLWDKTAYTLGVTAREGRRTADEHAAFVRFHREALKGAEDAGLRALLAFLEWWRPEQFAEPGWPEAMKDQNVVFALESERLKGVMLHDRPAAREVWARLVGGGGRSSEICLVTGESGPVARLHPAIKGVWGAQSSGASIVSFNLDAFTSYGHEQGDNAPISERAAFAYTTALSTYLGGKTNRIQIGDASTVFWADGSAAAESIFAAMFGGPDQSQADAADASKLRAILDAIRDGRPTDFAPDLDQGVRFHVLGLAPNAARLSVRFWLEDEFGRVAANYRRFLADMAMEPGPRRAYPALWMYLRELAVQGKSENVPPNLAGDWMRAILTGQPYPHTLLATALMRCRSDADVNAFRAAMLRAVLVRNLKTETPMALDPDNPSPAYQLGRLFAVMEQAQRAALGRVNATIGDRYYAAASATPARVFGPLLRGLHTHVADARKRNTGGWIAPKVGAIIARLPADLPKSLNLEDQARFAIGYYHEKETRHAAPEDVTEETADA